MPPLLFTYFNYFIPAHTLYNTVSYWPPKKLVFDETESLPRKNMEGKLSASLSLQRFDCVRLVSAAVTLGGGHVSFLTLIFAKIC